MTWRMVSAVFETERGELVTVGDAPDAWAEKVVSGPQDRDSEITLDGSCLIRLVGMVRAEMQRERISGGDVAFDRRELARLREIEAEARAILRAYAPLRDGGARRDA